MKFKNFKKPISLILTLATVLSASLAISNLSAKAENTGNLFKDGNFENDSALDSYYFTNSSKNPISLADYKFDEASETNKAVKIYRPVSNGDANGNALSQKLDLEAGNYKLIFDLDVESTNKSAYAFYYGVYSGTADSYGRFYTSSSTGSNISTANLTERSNGSLNGVNNYKADKNDYRLSFSGNNGNMLKAKAILEFTVDGTEENLYWSVCVGAGTTAYIDNIFLLKVDSDELLTNGNFEYGSLYGYTYSYGTKNPTATDRITVSNGKAHIPARVGNNAYGRFLNQAVELEAGDYVFSFDADLTYTASGTFYFAAGDIDSYERIINEGAIKTSSAVFTVGGNSAELKYYNNVDKTGAFSIARSNTALSGNAKIYLTVTENKTVYFSMGINDANTTADIYNLSLKKLKDSRVSLREVPTTGMFNASRTMDENYFIPYGGAVADDGTVLTKDQAGWFNTVSYKNTAINTVYFKKPSADGITTFGASFKADEDKTKNGIQFGSYTESVNNKEFYTLVIRGNDEAAVNALTTEQKTELVNKYLNWNSELADKWGKCTVDGTAYVIKVVKQKNYMWKDADTDNTKLQYAVRLYGDYSGDNGNVVFSAIGFSKSGDTVSFADSFKTASYNGLAG